ncbi:hypothetical protein D3C72_2022070 [compost metagenome]
MHHHQQRRPFRIAARIQFGIDACMVGRVDRIDALLPLRGRQPGIARHHGVVADLGDQRGRKQRAVAVDQQPRIGLLDCPRIQTLGQCTGGAADADVPADMPVQFGLRQTKIGQRTRHLLAGMIGQQQER